MFHESPKYFLGKITSGFMALVVARSACDRKIPGWNPSSGGTSENDIYYLQYCAKATSTC